MFVLTRDHLKIMRSALVGLDEPRRQSDRRPKIHDVRLILDKWHEATVGPQPTAGRPVRLEIDSRYERPLVECCLEGAALDRIFYNVAQHASRRAEAGQPLTMTIFPVPGAPDGGCLRFVLAAGIDAEHAARLRALGVDGSDSADRGHGRSLFALFEPEHPSGEADVGLRVVADFVAGAFGLRDHAEALRERYVGAVLDGHTLRLWFHWLLAQVPPGAPRLKDDYRRPRESLSEES